MSDAMADKIKAAREILIGLNATDEQMNALADVFDFGADTIKALRAENARLQTELAEYKRNGIVDVTGSINYYSGYDDGLEAAANVADNLLVIIEGVDFGVPDAIRALRAARAAMGER